MMAIEAFNCLKEIVTHCYMSCVWMVFAGIHEETGNKTFPIITQTIPIESRSLQSENHRVNSVVYTSGSGYYMN